MTNQIDKKLPASQENLKEKEALIKLASETAVEERDMSDFMDMKYEMALEKTLQIPKSYISLKFIGK